MDDIFLIIITIIAIYYIYIKLFKSSCNCGKVDCKLYKNKDLKNTNENKIDIK